VADTNLSTGAGTPRLCLTLAPAGDGVKTGDVILDIGGKTVSKPDNIPGSVTDHTEAHSPLSLRHGTRPGSQSCQIAVHRKRSKKSALGER
jgi:hypothetical protein